MLAKKTSKNQLTLPKEIVKAFSDVNYFDVTVKDKKIVLIPVKITPMDITLEGVRSKIEKLGIAEKDVSDAVKWARKRQEIVKRILKRRKKLKAIPEDVSVWIKEGRQERDSR